MDVSFPLMCISLVSLKTPATRCLTDDTCLQSQNYPTLHGMTQFYINKLTLVSVLTRNVKHPT